MCSILKREDLKMRIHPDGYFNRKTLQYAPQGCKNSSMYDRASHSWVQAHLTSTACMCHNPMQLPLPTGDTATGAWQNQNRKSLREILRGEKKSSLSCWACIKILLEWSPRPFFQGGFSWMPGQGKTFFFFFFLLAVHYLKRRYTHCHLLPSCCSSKRHAPKHGGVANVVFLYAVRDWAMPHCPGEHDQLWLQSGKT